ncbi:sulfur carrier protein ThiS [Candidatus Pelagibacter communis]|uniref:sulfur carrier protein ThiS n=1 Tax=Pelagibacter ubique TaxID=198252 RepID=UPI00094CAB22|nr:sulfur carrier protein ThiS [Candidatus Pelagibacter ubique]|tara:strand:+ start:669 stop:887 length:219 start_codon:yes stop_codon:yes gene_type:complete
MKKLKKIKIRVNGKIKIIIDKLTLYQLLNDLNIPITKVAIELNKEIVNKKKLKKMKLKNKDIIEIVHFIGGG